MAISYLLDTNILILAINGSRPGIQSRLAQLAPSRLLMSTIVLAELLTGAENSGRPTAALAAVSLISEAMTLAGFDAEDAACYARIRASLERDGKMIGPMDALIAAQALARGAILVTDNLREFERVAGLQVQNWR